MLIDYSRVSQSSLNTIPPTTCGLGGRWSAEEVLRTPINIGLRTSVKDYTINHIICILSFHFN